MDGNTIALVAALSSAAAAIFAATQIAMAAQAQRRNATFSHLRQIDERLQAVWQLNVSEVCQEIRTAYSSAGVALSADAAKYLGLLNALELLALEMTNAAVDEQVARDYLSTLCRSQIIQTDVILAIQNAWNDNKIYRELSAVLQTLGKASVST